MGFISGFVGINMEIIACITYNQKLELPSGVIKRGWPRNPRAKWRFVAGKIWRVSGMDYQPSEWGYRSIPGGTTGLISGRWPQLHGYVC